MIFRALLAVSALLLPGCISGPSEKVSAGLQLVDLTPEFARVWERTAGMDDTARVAAVKSHFAPIIPGFYGHERTGASDSKRYDERLSKVLAKFPEDRAGIEEVSRRFSSMLTPAQARFEAEFGKMSGYPPIYLVHSLGEFDGGTRSLPGGVFLMFGADVIARIHLSHDIRPFFHHELFHLYHIRSFRECEAVWCGLWAEGLATYVASKLNPQATDAELLLTLPEPLRPVIERNRKSAVCAVAKRLNSEDEKDYLALFSSRRLQPDLPPRFGYYVGYLLAAELGKTHSLMQLAGMSNDAVRPLVESTLRGMADCGA